MVKIYTTRKIAGINAKNPIDSPFAMELDEGKKTVNKYVKPIKTIQVIQKPKILFLKLCCPNLPINDFLQISICFRVTPFYIISNFFYFALEKQKSTSKSEQFSPNSEMLPLSKKIKHYLTSSNSCTKCNIVIDC